MYPIGIDPKELLALAQSPGIQQRVQELKKSFAGKKIIVARDRLEKSNGTSLSPSLLNYVVLILLLGVLQKLAAVEQLLTTHPSWHGNLVYLQICEPSTSFAQQEAQSDLAASVFE